MFSVLGSLGAVLQFNESATPDVRSYDNSGHGIHGHFASGSRGPILKPTGLLEEGEAANTGSRPKFRAFNSGLDLISHFKSYQN
jgi:hypothetical protein